MASSINIIIGHDDDDVHKRLDDHPTNLSRPRPSVHGEHLHLTFVLPRQLDGRSQKLQHRSGMPSAMFFFAPDWTVEPP